MLKLHPLYPNPLSGDIALWRYMDFWKFEDMLRSASLCFARAGSLLRFDAKEGSLTTRMQDFFDQELFTSRFVLNLRRQGVTTFGRNIQVKDHPTIEVRDELRRHARLHYDYLLTRTYVNSWSMNADENYLMWSSYIRAAPGVAVRTSSARLERALTADQKEVFAVPIEYIDHNAAPLNWERLPGGMSQIVLDMLTKKMRPFRDEREVRLVADILRDDEKWAPNLVGSHLDLTQENALTFLRVAVNLDDLIEEIVVHPRTGKEFRERVQATISELVPSNIGLERRVRQSVIM